MKPLALFSLIVFKTTTMIAQNVGIGIATPVERLHVNGGHLKIGNTLWTTGNTSLLKFGDGDFITVGEEEADDILTIRARELFIRPSSIYAGIPLTIQGSTQLSHFYYGSTEDTYIRGGKTSAHVLLNDIGSGNVGIGTAGPSHARLEVDGSVGNAVGIFGSAAFAGVSLNRGFPEVGLNYYFNSGNKTIAPGYAAVIGMNPVNGDTYIGNFNGNQSLAAYSDISGYTDRVILKQNGNFGIGVASPATRLDVNGSIKMNGTLTSASTGLANLVPLAYGKVKYDGTILSGTGNFTVTKVGPGDFEITIAGETNLYLNRDRYMVFTSASSTNNGNSLTVHDFRSNNAIGVTEGGVGSISYNNSGCALCADSWSYITNASPLQIANVNFNFIVYKVQ